MGRGRRTRGVMAVATALALVAGAALVALTGRVAIAGAVVVDTGTTLQETSQAPFSFVNRSYEELPLNTSITVKFFNSDPSTPHTFTILNRSRFAVKDPATFSNSALGSLLKTYGTLVNVSASGGSYAPTGTIAPISAPGWYEFVCTEQGHFQSGMYGYVAFGMALPANLTFGSSAPGPGLAVFIIIGTIVALTVLAIVLGFVVGQRRGAEHEMPPERLGYPEPSLPEAPASRPPSGAP